LASAAAEQNKATDSILVAGIGTKLILDTMRTSLAIATLWISAACASAPPTRYAADVPVEKQGRYAFQEAVRGSSRTLVLEGEFVVSADTVTVTERSAACEPVRPPDLRHFVVRCGDLTLSFDRRDPARAVAYRATDYTLTEESACVGRRILVGDQPVCGQTATDQREVRGRLSGVIYPRRVASTQR
jgi:hypothetical protein